MQTQTHRPQGPTLSTAYTSRSCQDLYVSQCLLFIASSYEGRQVRRYQQIQSCLPHVLDLEDLQMTAEQVDEIVKLVPCLQVRLLE